MIAREGLLTPGIRLSTFGIMKSTAARRSRAIDDTDASCAVECIDQRRVDAVRAAAPAGDAIERVAERFSALSDPTRIRLLHALSRAELCVCDLAKVAGRSMPATSQQLQLLRRLGLVKYRNEGKLAYYTVADAWARGALKTALDDVQGASQ